MKIIAMPAFANRNKNPYNWLLYTSIQKNEVNVDEFSFYQIWRKKYKIWHLHWPDIPLNNRNPIKAFIKIRALLIQIKLAKYQGVKIVWTAHNLWNHDRLYPKLEAWFWHNFTKSLDGYISLSKSGMEEAQKRFPELNNIPGFVIPHNHYRGEYSDNITYEEARRILSIPPNTKVILFFGRIRAYKNLSQLIQVFRQISDPHTLLYIVGKPEIQDFTTILNQENISNLRLRTHLDFVPHENVQIYFRAANLVVLPYREILNSGTALLSLSFNTPVLVPLQGAMGELQAQVGEEWVRTYEGDITKGEITAALQWALNTPRPIQTPLENFDIKILAQQTIDAYKAILASN